jgi:hypothetical protein
MTHIEQLWFAFSSREKAITIYLALFLIWLPFQPTLRPSLVQLIRSAFNVKILASWTFLAAYTILITALLKKYSLWNDGLLPETLVWYFGTAIASIVRIASKNDDLGFFWKIIKSNIAFSTLVVVFISLYSLPLIAEMILVPLMVALGALIAFGGTKPDYAPTTKLLHGCLTTLGCFIGLICVISIVVNYHKYLNMSTLAEFALPLVLSVCYIPILYCLAVFMRYEALLLRLRFMISNNDSVLHKSRNIIYRSCKLNIARIDMVSHYLFPALMGSTTTENTPSIIQQLCLLSKTELEEKYREWDEDAD